MMLRCPDCNYNLAHRVSETCPECGGVFTDQQLIAYARSAAHPHPRADLVFHGCAIVACGFVASVIGLLGLVTFEVVPTVIGGMFVLGTVGLGISMKRVSRRKRAMRGDD